MPECSVCGEEFPEEDLLHCRQCSRKYCDICSELNDDDLCPDCRAKEEEKEEEEEKSNEEDEEEEEGLEDYADEGEGEDFYG
jgi:hypothetical protein